MRRPSGLVVMVPAAEPLVGAWRDRLDPSARLGIPAHVTVLYPFVPADDIDQGVVDRAAAVVAGRPAFTYSLSAVGWFGEEVVYLVPEPADAFVGLTTVLAEAFPGCPPYGGVHDDVVPHLTVGDGAPVDDLSAAAGAVAAGLPVSDRAEEVCLMVRSRAPRAWAVRDRLPLGGRSPSLPWWSDFGGNGRRERT